MECVSEGGEIDIECRREGGDIDIECVREGGEALLEAGRLLPAFPPIWASDVC